MGKGREREWQKEEEGGRVQMHTSRRFETRAASQYALSCPIIPFSGGACVSRCSLRRGSDENGFE